MLDAPTLARMQAASYLHADAQGGEDLDEEEEHGYGPFDEDGDSAVRWTRSRRCSAPVRSATPWA